MALTQDIASCAPSYSRLFAELIQLFHQIAILQIVDQHFDLSPEYADLLQKFSQAMSPEDVQLYYQICVNGRKDLSYASDEQAAFDMTLLRLFAFKPMQKEQLPAVNESSFSPSEIKNSLDDSFTLPQSEVTSSELSEEPSTSPLQVAQETEQKLAQELEAIEQQAFEIQASEVQELSVEPEILSAQLFDPVSELELPQSQAPVKAVATTHEVEPLAEQIEEDVSKQALESSQSTEFDSPLKAVLATRNMLRSRKKQLDKQEKKFDDAIARQSSDDDDESIEKDKIDVTNQKVELAKPEQPYQADNINPATIRKANQVDEWAHMIDSMELTARLRQLAIHATIDDESTEEHLILCLNQATKHLVTDTAQQQLQQNISQFLSREISVTIKTVEETVADPFQIQSDINKKRYDYAKELLEKDEIVQALQRDFQANLDEDSISAL
jgi:DNA polymerase-3 subunit gamma/tau